MLNLPFRLRSAHGTSIPEKAMECVAFAGSLARSLCMPGTCRGVIAPPERTMKQTFDIVVVGAGHAGCESAAAAARMGCRVACVTLNLAYIARLSCNPAIGGLAKGHLVRELDALGGVMGRVADRSCIQFRRLNTRKGLAVRSSRAQVDIDMYPAIMREMLQTIPNLTLVEGEVSGVLMRGGKISAVTLADGRVLETPKVILTTGTFLSAVLHCGTAQTRGGRIDDGSSYALADSLRSLNLQLGRLKTGTPPRLDGRTIDWAQIPVQEDTVPEGRFSFGPRVQRPPQVNCHLVHTNAKTHEVIRSGLDRSPLFTGVIEGTGPRYCPSIEDKVVRFPDRGKHLIFLEPEGLNTHRVYPNGVSTSLPEDVQDEMIRTLPGLEDCVIEQYGHAVEYDYADPTELGRDLQHKEVPGLYFAGQVNGTSGYEEAGVQGFVAGVSAALGEVFHVKREEGYLGVLVDDLVSRGIGGEPYRMFTSRAEHRLLLREDNADRRLMPRGRALGLVDDETWRAFEDRQEQRERAMAAARATMLTPGKATNQTLKESGVGPLRRPSSVEEVLRRPGVCWEQLVPLMTVEPISAEVAEQVEIDIKYSGYVERAKRRVLDVTQMDRVVIPPGIEWMKVDALSWEIRERLTRLQPTDLGQIHRLPGVTPAAVNVVAALVGRMRGR